MQTHQISSQSSTRDLTSREFQKNLISIIDHKESPPQQNQTNPADQRSRSFYMLQCEWADPEAGDSEFKWEPLQKIYHKHSVEIQNYFFLKNI